MATLPDLTPDPDCIEMVKAPTEHDYGMPVHPLCDLFPLMDPIGFERLLDDIRDNGLTVPMVIHDGQLVDGRNRLLVCRRLQSQYQRVEPRFVQWRDLYHGEQSLERWIWSVNAERRHLTPDQWLAAQVAFLSWDEQETAKRKQIEGGKTAGRGRPQQGKTNPSEPIAKSKPAPQVRTKLAKRLDASEHRVQQVLNVKADPELLKQVTQGKIKLVDAAKQVKKPAPAKKQASAEPGDLRPIMRPVLAAIDAALRQVVTDDQRLALVKAAYKGKPTMERWAQLEKRKNSQREAFITAMENWVEDLD